MNTPWGDLFDKTEYAPGFFSFSTGSHGGVAFSPAFALKHLSNAAIRRAIFYNGYLFYEEDCDWMIPLYELEEYWGIYYKKDESKEEQISYLKENSESLRSDLYRHLLENNMDYLIELGEVHDGDREKFLLEHENDGELYGYAYNPNPDRIISAINATIVTTEDGKIHFVTESSYQNQVISKFKNQCKYVSECKVIDPNVLKYMDNWTFTVSTDEEDLDK